MIDGQDHRADADRVRAWRNRLNALILVVPGQWITLMVVYWARFYGPLRPLEFVVPFPHHANFLIGCAVAIVPFLLPKTYFVPRAFERGRLYPALGVRAFRYLATDGVLVARLLRRLDPAYRVVRDRATLGAHVQGTYANERWHLSFFIAGAFTAVHAVNSRQYMFAGLLIATNVAFNLYPVLHQRYKRARARHLTGSSRVGRGSTARPNATSAS